MSNKIPQEVALQIKQVVFTEANRANYLAMSRTDSGSFINNLTARGDIGGELAKFIKKDQIRHYIKDGILNRYSKDKTKEATPDDVRSIIKDKYELDVSESHSEEKLQLFRSLSPHQPKEFVVVSQGTYLKWETSLKKALLFISANPFSKEESKTHILLLLFAQYKPITPADKKNLENALKRCGATLFIFGER